MRYLAAFLLWQLGGKEKPTENDIKTVLNSVGIEHDSERLTKLLSFIVWQRYTTINCRRVSKVVFRTNGRSCCIRAFLCTNSTR
uniref:Large ribosomal subunit protein P2 n=1 Tax=Schistosoma japonicum TaxID=6182 RepID=C1LWB4_SCHJA|nr:ribosomal protein, large P2 [Schistosoma japonicum]